MDQAAVASADAWVLAQEAARAIGSFDPHSSGYFALGASGGLRRVESEDPDAVLEWLPAAGWRANLATDDPRSDLLDLYLPISSATLARPITIAHLGQSLDGFIATHSGDAISVTGPQNILHLHRLRALCDAVIVGAGTVVADNPRLTTRLVTGTNPARVILDPACRLPAGHTVFKDGAALTLRVCGAGNEAALRARGRGENTLEVAIQDGALDLNDLVRQLRARGYARIFVEGGGVTVSSFLSAGLLDRLHIAVAPLLIGEGRPAIRLPAQARLEDCMRLRHRVFLTGGDILFDCDLRGAAQRPDAPVPWASADARRVL